MLCLFIIIKGVYLQECIAAFFGSEDYTGGGGGGGRLLKCSRLIYCRRGLFTVKVQ